ncbi:MAG: maleylpyruvate isomerase family mycothiol-dependent enzyme [Acidimicrobiia bacterium]
MDFVSHIRSDSDLFRDRLAGVDPEASVPCCPEWAATDLAWHLTEVQWFWGTIVAERLTDSDSAEESKPDRPAGHSEVLAMFDIASARLTDALATTADDEPVWTWYPPDQSVGFIRRRQAHEALIHRADAQLTTGSVPALDPAMAEDGVDEMLHVMIGGVPDWAHFEPDGLSMRIHATDVGRRWGLAFGHMTGTSPTTGNTYDLEAVTVGLDATEAQAGIEGTAEALDLWLWGRGPVEDLTVAGDTRLVDKLRALAVEETQ